MLPDVYGRRASRMERRIDPEPMSAFLERPNRVLHDCSDPLDNIPLSAGIHRSQVSPWVDFNLENLTEAYGDILSKTVTAGYSDPADPLYIAHSGGLKSLGIDYISPHLREPLSIAASEVWGRLVPVTSSFQPQLSLQLQPGDLTFSQYDLRLDTPISLAVGCVKLARQWHSSTLSTSLDIALHPINQVIDYCQAAQTRYGFILTNEELVVVRVSHRRVGTTKKPHAEYKAIPWSASGEGVLTVRLALWFLFVMSMNAEHRPIRTSDEVLPLNLWWKAPGSNMILYQHHLSKRERLSLPPGAQFRMVWPEMGEIV
ncbi:hypothetical protein NM208_g12771 [Fusarium decemcellulare]|uniref:Uncharacterized protein n=1 Tax=Fusarium decemcellulare TaxID=57161 RepID=A0ACC1RPD3_9HYPO|nr:hypothetical protein NM208_g12771 [Fusarium decemcellulare]